MLRSSTSLICLALAVFLPCCSPSPEKPSVSPTITAAKRFRELLRDGDHDAARAMMAKAPRRWFDERSGEGRPWHVGPGKRGPWAAWDEHFGKRSEEIGWRANDHSATLIYKETNDYFLLLERGWVTNETVYFFDSDGRIEGLLIRPAAGPRSQGRTGEFLAWARENAPEELAELMPDGEIDPSGDHPQRFRALLETWRAETGLPPIE
jgi:hypothetical protein